jgi:peptidoglycan/LPS O-acetylase OafA/YrhL
VLLLRNRGLIDPQALIFLYPFVVLAATDPTRPTSRLLGSRVVHFFGVISYSIYMMHVIVCVLFIAAFQSLDPWPTRAFALATVFVVSVATYFLIEMPARNAIRGLQRMRRAPYVP